MRFTRTTHTIQLLQLLIWAGVILPVSLFLYAGWVNYRALDVAASERAERNLDVLQEHALKVFQTIDRTIAETNEVLRGLSDDEIRADEARLQARLARTQRALPQVEAIWAFDRNGRPLLASTLLPVPSTLNNADRDYFKAQVAEDGGTYIGSVLAARVGDARFFVVSQRRSLVEGRFDGVIAVTVPPDSLRDFYARVAQSADYSAALIRADGVFLARFPDPGTKIARLGPGNLFEEAIVRNPVSGSYTNVSQIDGVERRTFYRKIPGYGVYVQAGFTTAALWRDLRSIMVGHLIFGLPASALLVILSFLVLRQTHGFVEETKRREVAEAALKQAQRLEAVGQLTGGVAHDFNNLLMVVNGNVDRLRRDLSDPRHTRALDAIDKAARRGASLTRQLLTFSRQQTVDPMVIQLRQRLPKLREMLQSSLRGDIVITLDVPDSLWRVRVDPGELELAILNLGINARDAMPNGGTLTLSARNVTLGSGASPDEPRGDFVVISVKDTGTGIAPDVLPKVFEPFFTTKEVGKGTGLGLSQVYGFVKQAGGAATVASEVGRGTEIALFLPRSHGEVEGQEEPQAGLDRPRGNGTILLVEDNAEIADVSKANLEQLGYRILHAPNAQAALEVVEQDRSIDLVFSDIVMPGAINGLDLARRLREFRPGLPVVLTTGYSSALRSAMPEGFSLLTKPYDLTSLHRIIEETLQRRGAKVLPLALRRQD